MTHSQDAVPLDLASVVEMLQEGRGSQLVRVDGQFFDLDDMARCARCEEMTTKPYELDENQECEDCAAESLEDIAEQKSLESYMQWACR